MIRSMQRYGVVGVVLFLCGFPTAAHAGAQDKAVAESLYRDAITQMKQGDYKSACPKLAESQRLEPAVGTLLYLGECYEQVGLTASAWATFTAAIDAARRVNNREREQIASERANNLADKVLRLRIEVPEQARVEGLEIKEDGRVVGEAAWGVALPIDPGIHTFEASAPGRRLWTKQLNLDITTRGVVTETVPLLEMLAPEPVAAPAPAPAQPALQPQPLAQPLPTDETNSRSRTLQLRSGVALTGVGVVALTVGTVFGLKARSKEKDSEAYCWSYDKTRCSHQGVVLIDEAKSAATIANVAIIGGAVAIIGGGVLYFTAPKVRASSSASLGTKLELVPEFSPVRSTLTLQGRF